MSETAEWEVVDDDGFVYKRRRKRPVLPAADTLVKCQDPVLSDHEELGVREAMARRKKLAMLLAQKEMYEAEVRDWEIILSKQEEALACAPVPESPIAREQISLHSVEDASFKDGLQTLDLQVEAYEGFIEQLQNLIGQGERICQQLEKDTERDRKLLEQELMNDVFKFTPRSIIGALSSEQPPLPTLSDLPVKSLLGRLLAE